MRARLHHAERRPTLLTNKQMPSYTASEPSAVAEFKPLDGDYWLRVEEAEDTLSKASNDCIKLRLKVEGEGQSVWEYLVFEAKSFWKIDLFRAACGEHVMAGEQVDMFAANLIGKRCRATLACEPAKGQYKAKNVVAAWLPVEAADVEAQEEDDIPF